MSKDLNEVVITKGSAREADRRALARLICGAYEPVTQALRIKKDIALAVLEESMDLEQCFVAWKDGSVVGFQGLVEKNAHPFHFRFKLIRAHYGLFRSLMYFILMNARSWRKLPPGEMLLENLVVSVEERRQGIGSRLIERAEDYAREKGYKSVGTEVVDTNRIALQIFTRMSYEVVRSRRTGMLTRKAGFTGNHYFRKRLLST